MSLVIKQDRVGDWYVMREVPGAADVKLLRAGSEDEARRYLVGQARQEQRAKATATAGRGSAAKRKAPDEPQ
jgi:hypothetical protein